jgi:hypothetical protein
MIASQKIGAGSWLKKPSGNDDLPSLRGVIQYKKREKPVLTSLFLSLV